MPRREEDSEDAVAMSILIEAAVTTIVISLVLLVVAFIDRAAKFRRGESNAVDYLSFRELGAKGYNLDEPISTLFGFFVNTESSAAHIVRTLGTEYTCEIEKGGIEFIQPSTNVAETRDGWLVYARRSLILNGAVIADLRRSFDAIALKESGLFLGWKVASQWGSAGQRISAQASPTTK